jgi:glyoxylase-like metal-dependent hydrolase (beta-lactamase superfamily II)
MLEEMKTAGYLNLIKDEEPGLTGIGTEPAFAIGQRSLLVQTPHGNVLWDCMSFIDDETISRVRVLGGVQGIAASHPHFYGIMVEWSQAFDGAPIYIPEADKRWVARPDPAVRYWEGSLEVVPGVTLVQCGGHFEGSAVLHWKGGAGGKGALLVGDTITVVMDREYVSFMRSYPNLIPLPASAINGILDAVRPSEYDRIYGGWWDRVVPERAAEAVERSARRYLSQIRDQS